MALLKSLRRSTDNPDAAKGAPSASAEAVQQARQQARRRLIGAVILLGIGVIGFPIVFQTQPRPIPVDIPIEIPKRDAAPPLTVGSPSAGTATSQAPAAATAAAPVEPVPVPPVGGAAANAAVEPSTGSRGAAPGAVAGVAAAVAAGAAPADRPRDVEVEVVPPAGKSATPSGAKAAAVAGAMGPSAAPSANPSANPSATKPAAVAAPAASAAVKPSGPAASASDSGRFVVQAGSYTDAETVREVRAKLERLGLKTYTQVAMIEGVSRTRVRVGPFASRSEAVEVQNKIKAAGVAASLLAL